MADFLSFKERLVSEPAFYEKYKGQRDVQTIIAMAKADGYEFTEEDILQNTEVTEAELACLAGGLTGVVGEWGPYGGILG